VIGTIAAAVLSPLGLLLTGAVALGAYLVHSSGIGAQAIAYLGDQFSVLKNDAIASWGAIGKALASGDIAAAGKILWLTLKMEWIRGTNWLHGHWLSFKNAFLATTQSIIYGAAGLLSDGWAAIEVAWIETVAFLGDSWSVFTGTLMKTWNSTVGFIRKAWVRLKSLFDSEIQVDAEIQRINQETAAKNESAGDSMLGQLAERDQQRRTARGEIEQRSPGARRMHSSKCSRPKRLHDKMGPMLLSPPPKQNSTSPNRNGRRDCRGQRLSKHGSGLPKIAAANVNRRAAVSFIPIRRFGCQ
jgi:hypothetical protein